MTVEIILLSALGASRNVTMMDSIAQVLTATTQKQLIAAISPHLTVAIHLQYIQCLETIRWGY